ncbi:MAG TPA: hypothetical protein VFO93_17765 [Hymenobacter sp.]|uniref:hypothetical protein n=1 Tax=Hymenobacter sp. TaxID=1898978 RepID=UPI002D811378|nr:hypothetical protein [Hymenobacter sp.]HET9505396.1 hypothetical protein [Hymenobacter sp.]
MKTITELNASKVPLVIIDPALNKLRDVVLFPEKVEKAKQAIAQLGIPNTPVRPVKN